MALALTRASNLRLCSSRHLPPSYHSHIYIRASIMSGAAILPNRASGGRAPVDQAGGSRARGRGRGGARGRGDMGRGRGRGRGRGIGRGNGRAPVADRAGGVASADGAGPSTRPPRPERPPKPPLTHCTSCSLASAHALLSPLSQFSRYPSSACLAYRAPPFPDASRTGPHPRVPAHRLRVH